MPDSIVARQFEWMNLKNNLVWIYDGPVSMVGRSGWFETGYLSAWLIRRGNVRLQAEGEEVCATGGEWLLPWAGSRHKELAESLQKMGAVLGPPVSLPAAEIES